MKSPRVTSAVVTLGVAPVRAFMAIPAPATTRMTARAARTPRLRRNLNTALLHGGRVSRYRDPFLDAGGHDRFVGVHRADGHLLAFEASAALHAHVGVLAFHHD